MPLPAVLLVTFLGSIGTGAVTNGIYFLTDTAFGFGRTRNLLLGCVFGGIYVLGAVLVAPALTRLEARSPRLTPRRVLIGLHIALGLVCLLPKATELLHPSRVPQEWSVWVMAVVYAAVTGALWPIIEAYLSGGRKGATLRSATGKFNIFWSIALVAAFWAMGPLRAIDRPLELLTALGVIHIATLFVLRWFSPSPAAHGVVDPEPSPPAYRDLLTVLRWLLPASYLIMSTLSPLLPALLAGAEIRGGWVAPAASIWMAARVLVFWLFERWQGWHGRWWVAIVGIIGAVAGFGMCILAPLAGDPATQRVLLFSGLALFGAAQGLIYLAALYYAMELAGADIGGGGAHESLIGAGYFAGPVLGLTAAVIVGPETAAFGPVVLSAVFVIVSLITLGTLLHVARQHRRRQNPHKNRLIHADVRD